MEQPYYIPQKETTFLHLEKPLIFFDLETTGTHPSTDRIVELCAVKLHPDGTREELYHLINPTIPISPGASAVHGITDEKVANKPTFGDLVNELAALFEGCDLGGYNIKKFDVPLLMEEFHRHKKYPISYSEVKLVDAMGIYHSKEKRDLSAAVKFYCDREHGEAHSAKADVLATIDILKHQLLRYEDLEPNTSFLHDYVSTGGYEDFSGKFVRDKSGTIVFNFGQHKGKEAASEPGFLKWMLDKDFTIDTKMVATRILKNREWKDQIHKWLNEQSILLDTPLAYALYTTLKFGTDITPFTTIRQGKKVTLTYHTEPPVTLPFPHPDAVAILLQQLEGYFTEIGGYEAVGQKIAAAMQP